jgi:hypothetical protein
MTCAAGPNRLHRLHWTHDDVGPVALKPLGRYVGPTRTPSLQEAPPWTTDRGAVGAPISEASPARGGRPSTRGPTNVRCALGSR